MIFFAHPVGNFVNLHPSLQVLGLSFLLLIGVMLLAEAAQFVPNRNIGPNSGVNPQRLSLFRYCFFTGSGVHQYEVEKKTINIIGLA